MSKVLKYMETAVFVFLAAAITVMFVSGVMQVFFRYVVHYAFSWTEELMRFLYVWVTMLGASICVRRGQLAAIKGLQNRLGPVPYAIIAAAVVLVQSAFLCLMIYFGTRFAIRNANQLSPALRLPMCYMQASVPVGGFFSLVFLLASVPEMFRRKEVTA